MKNPSVLKHIERDGYTHSVVLHSRRYQYVLIHTLQSLTLNQLTGIAGECIIILMEVCAELVEGNGL